AISTLSLHDALPISVIDGRLVDNELHLARLERSVKELGIPLPASLDAIRAAQIELIVRNKMHEGVVYMQVTRGEAERDFVYTDEDRKSTRLNSSHVK